MIGINKFIKRDKIAYKISRAIQPYEFMCSVEMHAVLIDKNVCTDIAIDILDKAVMKRYKGYKLMSNYFDHPGKFINYSIKENYYIGFITVNKPYKSYAIGFYSLNELKNYSHEGLTMDEMILDIILKEGDIYL